ncbi:MAG: alpha/beta hydrolase, partial [Micropepsaceae bacterium]
MKSAYFRHLRRVIAHSASAATCLALAACAQVDERRTACLAGLWQSEPDKTFALNVREDSSIRVTAFDGRVWTLEISADRWSGSQGQGGSNTTDPVTLDDAQCQIGRLLLTQKTATSELRRVELEQHIVKFRSDTETLTGKLVVRKGYTPDNLVVLLHGSEKRSAVAANPLQYLLPSKGIAAFVFDKRGTGRSSGEYTHNFELLARDGVAALATAHSALGGRNITAGFLGGSQGAWVAPLAAARTPKNARPRFVIAAYGLGQGPLEEDREEVFDDLRRHGFGDAATLAKAREITDATATVMRTNFVDGFDRLNTLKDKYGHEPWYSTIEGEFTGDFLWMPSWLLAVVGPFFEEGMIWDYDPLPIIESLPMPMLWVLAGKDTEAP